MRAHLGRRQWRSPAPSLGLSGRGRAKIHFNVAGEPDGGGYSVAGEKRESTSGGSLPWFDGVAR